MRLPVWFPKNNEDPPQLCGAVEAHSTYIAKVCFVFIYLYVDILKKIWIVVER